MRVSDVMLPSVPTVRYHVGKRSEVCNTLSYGGDSSMPRSSPICELLRIVQRKNEYRELLLSYCRSRKETAK